MRIGMQMSSSGGFAEAAAAIAEYEAAGVDAVFVGEAYSFDAVSQLGYLAARTSTEELVSGILNTYSRTPALLAMTAAGLDFFSVPEVFVRGVSLIGPRERVAERVAAFADAGVTTLNAQHLGEDHQTRLRPIETLKAFLS